MSVTVRLAVPADVPVLSALIERSARGLSDGFYTTAQVEALLTHVFGVDSTLIADGTYFAAVEVENDTIRGCGGWSRRRTLYGGDQRKVGDTGLLDPAVDAARIRAFYVDPAHARRGIARRLYEQCARAAREAGFSRLELMATLPGVPLYAALGFHEIERVVDVLPEGPSIDFVRMGKTLV